jgi:hypothetical protein
MILTIFLQEEWPYRLTSEGPLGIEDDAMGFGTKDDIVNLIKEAARILSKEHFEKNEYRAG